MHGVHFSTLPTSLTPPINADAGLIVAVGTAPVNLGDPNNVNKIKLCYTYDEAIAAFGDSTDFAKYTLSEVIYSQFKLFNVAPIVLINVLDPAEHKTSISAESKTLVNNQAKLSNLGAIKSSVVVKVAAATKVLGTDYTLSFNDDGYLLVNRLSSGSIAANATLLVDYDVLDPTAVTSADIIGGFSSNAYTGIELLDQVYPQTRKVPMQLIAPKYSKDPVVAAIMRAKVNKVNGLFGCAALVDIDETVATDYSQAPAYKVQNNLIDEHMDVYYGTAHLGEMKFHLSTQDASLTQRIYAEDGGNVYRSSSNNSLQMNGFSQNGVKGFLTLNQANYLNDNGIKTALNWTKWALWGNKTSAYPNTADPVKVFRQQRNLFNWIGNSLILTYFEKVDNPTNRVLIESVILSESVKLNGLTARGIILGGRIEFRDTDNPTTDLLAGKVRFRILLAGPLPAEDIEFMLEFDTTLLTTSNLGG